MNDLCASVSNAFYIPTSQCKTGTNVSFLDFSHQNNRMAENDMFSVLHDDSDSLYNEHEGTFGEDGVRRPMNAFFIFCKRHRDVVREKYPHLENRSITKILGEWWASLDASEKSSYTALAKQYKEAFMKAHPDFKWYKLPTPPTRTLITRPSNSRVQSKKDKNNLKLGGERTDDDESLSCLNSFISSVGMEMAPTNKADCHDTASSPCSVTGPASILKPPKKRYLVNGEFMCSSSAAKYDAKEDDPTRNACSALLELAEACASGANQSAPSCTASDRLQDNSLFHGLSTSVNSLCYSPLSTLQSLRQTPISPYLVEGVDPQKSTQSSISSPFLTSTSALSSSSFLETNVQDQPLDLCKGKEKTFTASNQQLIDHLVDKFLCSAPISPGKTVSETPTHTPRFSPSKIPSLSRKQLCQGYTLSNAIESAIDEAYSTDNSSPSTSKVPKVSKAETVTKVENHKVDSNENHKSEEKEDKMEVVFIDKIKKACLASSKKSPEKPKFKRYIIPLSLKEPEIKTNSVLPSKHEENGEDCSETPEPLSCLESDNSSKSGANLKRMDPQRFSSSKYYTKFVSPPKKSRVWCNLFMKEQLKMGDLDIGPDGKRIAGYNMSSPVRRNSQRTCKGQRYQALITEGLLQSTKERKQMAVKKPLPVVEKVKAKSTMETSLPLPRTKRKKRDLQGKWAAKKEHVDATESVFNLSEKIASLPKCSIETLDKKKRISPGSSTVAKVVSNERVASPKLQASESSSKGHQMDDSLAVSSSGRYKTGGFDLEQHIASLPKCDIEVLNKKRNKKAIE